MWVRKDQGLIILIGDFCHFRFERLLWLRVFISDGLINFESGGVQENDGMLTFGTR